MNIKTKIVVFKFNEDGTEKRIPGFFNSDLEAMQAIKTPGDYIFYQVKEVTAENIAELKVKP